MTFTGEWSPPRGPGSVLTPAGVRWDAVQVPDHLARPVLAELAEESGAVVHDRYARHHTWFVPPGTAAAWPVPEVWSVRLLGVAQCVEVPPVWRTEPAGPYWARAWRPGHGLTGAGPLREALDGAVRAVLGPREGGGR